MGRRQRLMRDIAMIAIAPLLLYLLVCLFTYSPQDPSWSQSGSVTAPLHNAGGTVGAWLADMLLGFLTGDYRAVAEVHFRAGYVPADQDANTVVAVLQKGYLIADRVLRPALVTVAAPR